MGVFEENIVNEVIAMNDEKKTKFWKFMYPYIKEYRGKLIFTAFTSVLVGVCVACQPLVIKYIVDSGISNTAFSAEEKLSFVGIMCLIYMVFSFGRIFMWRIGFMNMMKALEGSLFNLRSRFFKHIQDMCMKRYGSMAQGELFNCIMGSPIINIKTYMHQMFQTVPFQAVSLAISLIALLSYDWLLTSILVLMSFCMAVINHISRRKMKIVTSDYIRTEAEASKYLNDTLHGMDAIKLYSIEDDTFRTFQHFISEMRNKGVKTSVTQTYEAMKPELIQYVGTAIVYAVGASACIYRGMSVGTFYAFLSSMGNILGILISWLNIGLQKSNAEAGIVKIAQVFEQSTSTPEKIANRQRNIMVERNSSIAKGKPCIEFKNVTFGYDSKMIFEDFNCQIKHNESVALVGSSGSGKSTLTKLAMRLYDVSKGTVLVYDKDVKDYSIHDLRVSFGVVPQNPFIFYGSIWDNIKIARPDAANIDIIQAMEIAHVHEFVNDLEQGWNTIVGDGGVKLSGGQIQRIAIARAVLGKPDILIFDEATSALDNISEKHIQQAMEELMKTHTLIIVAHRLSTIKNVDRIMVFDGGKIVEEGTYKELENKGGMFSRLLNE